MDSEPFGVRFRLASGARPADLLALTRKVLVIQGHLDPPGGGQGVGAWVLEALKGEHEVTLLTLRPVDLATVNRYYGTSLTPAQIELRLASGALLPLLGAVPLPLALLKKHALLRRGRKMASGYDVVISLENESDLGRRGIQYVHYPWAYRPRPEVEMRWYHRPPGLLDLYYRVCEKVSDFSRERMAANVTLVNSDWTGRKMKEWYGIETTTLPPPAASDLSETPWEKRENGFLCIGRIAPEKRLERVIDILERVRAAGGNVHLHLVGGGSRSSYDRRIRALIDRQAAWVSLEEDLPRNELVRLISTHRYGIHGMEDEHFGMAVAEMVRGGCIVFVHASGGPPAVVGSDERLLYRTPEEAAQKILRVLANPSEQAALRVALERRRDAFSSTHFVGRIRELVRSWPA